MFIHWLFRSLMIRLAGQLDLCFDGVKLEDQFYWDPENRFGNPEVSIPLSRPSWLTAPLSSRRSLPAR